MMILSSSIDQSRSYFVSRLLVSKEMLTGIETITQGSKAADCHQGAEYHSPKLANYDPAEIESDCI
jgi:hypothetical protein